MFVSATELERRPLRFDVTFQPGEIAFSEELRQDGPLHAVGSAELLRNTLGEIRFRGHLKACMVAACDRCLEPAVSDINSDFDLFYRPETKPDDHLHHDFRIDDGEVDLSFYSGDGLELTEVLREFVLLSIPMRIVCKADCKGICPVCGSNRNLNDCKCDTRTTDVRWAALKNL